MKIKNKKNWYSSCLTCIFATTKKAKHLSMWLWIIWISYLEEHLPWQRLTLGLEKKMTDFKATSRARCGIYIHPILQHLGSRGSGLIISGIWVIQQILGQAVAVQMLTRLKILRIFWCVVGIEFSALIHVKYILYYRANVLRPY